MIITTTELIPGEKYEIIDIIMGETIWIHKTIFGNYKYLSIEWEAENLGANAVVGVKTTLNGQYMGTAVNFN